MAESYASCNATDASFVQGLASIRISCACQRRLAQNRRRIWSRHRYLRFRATFLLPYYFSALCHIGGKFAEMLFDSNTRLAGAQIQSQQSNIALLSALLLTIQFAFLYAFPATWSDLISDSYLANLMTEDQLLVLHEVGFHLSFPLLLDLSSDSGRFRSSW